MFDKWFVLLQKQLHGECGCLQKLSEWGLEYRSVGCQDSILACIKRLDLCDQPVSNFGCVSCCMVQGLVTQFPPGNNCLQYDGNDLSHEIRRSVVD